MRRTLLFAIVCASFFTGCASNSGTKEEKPSESNGNPLRYENEKHFTNIRQVTFGGDNAEAYWSFSGDMITFQSNNKAWGLNCDQIFYMHNGDDLKGHIPARISNGKGRTTCSYFMPGDSTILFASTFLSGDDCPPQPERNAEKYVWPVYSTYDIFIADLQGNILRQLTDEPGYDAEATLSPQGDKIVFTSDRSGDLELYTMNIDGSDVKQVTDKLGYDGGAFFSPDGTKLVFRASRPTTDEEVKEYKDLLSQGLVEPTKLEIFTCNVDGSDLKQITHLGKANWAPYFHPSGKKIIFSSNYMGTHGFEFNLFMINTDGTGLEQITYDPVFDSFPMFSPDGTKLIFSSNRNNNGTHDTNLFIADWKD